MLKPIARKPLKISGLTSWTGLPRKGTRSGCTVHQSHGNKALYILVKGGGQIVYYSSVAPVAVSNPD